MKKFYYVETGTGITSLWVGIYHSMDDAKIWEDRYNKSAYTYYRDLWKARTIEVSIPNWETGPACRTFDWAKRVIEFSERELA